MIRQRRWRKSGADPWGDGCDRP